MNTLVPSWYALYTRSRFEKRLLMELTGREVEVFLPVREVLSRWKDRKKKIWFPLFPGYIFIHHIDTPTNRHKVLNAPGAVRFVRFNGRPEPIPDEQIEIIRRLLEVNLAIDSYPYTKTGRRVQVLVGSLKGVQGKLVRKKGRTRLIIQVDSICKAVAIEVNIRDVGLI